MASPAERGSYVGDVMVGWEQHPVRDFAQTTPASAGLPHRALAFTAVRCEEFASESSAPTQWCVDLGRTSIFRRGARLWLAAGQLVWATDDEATMPSCGEPHSCEPVALGLYMKQASWLHS